MTAGRAAARGQAAAERLMADSCTIRRQTGAQIDPDTGAEVPEYDDIYEGKCRVQSRNLAGSSPNAGQQRVDLFSLELHVPVAATGVAVNDVAEVIASVDADLIGRFFRLSGPAHKTYLTARRLPIEEVTS